MQKKTKYIAGAQISITGDQNTLKSMLRKHLTLKFFIGNVIYLPIFNTLSFETINVLQ